jgi:hypothetical protein
MMCTPDDSTILLPVIIELLRPSLPVRILGAKLSSPGLIDPRVSQLK